MKFFGFLLVLALLPLGVAHAENGCPDGMTPNPTPTGTPGANQCIPGPSSGGSGWPPVVQRAPRSYNGYGAFALDEASMKVGVSDHKDLFGSERLASRSALKSCKANGGVDCKIILTYVNECAVTMLGADRGGTRIVLYTGKGESVSAAQAQAEGQCKSNASPMCKPAYANCVERWHDG